MMKKQALIPYLIQIRWRLRLRDGLSMAQDSLWKAVLASLLVILAGRLFPIEIKERVLAPLVLWLAGNIGYAIFRPLSIQRTARQADYELHLKERLSTSLALETSVDSPVYASFAPTLVEFAHLDALRTAQGIKPSEDFPLRLMRRPLFIAAGLLAAALVFNFLPNPMEAVISERKAVAEEAKRQAAQVEKIRQEIANAEEMSPEEREDLLKKLAELAKQLRANQGDREQALADLSRLEETLRNRLDPKGDQRRAALEAMAAQIQALAKNENPQIGDLEAAAKAIEQLAQQMESMSKEEREALAQQLAQMAARAAQAGDGALAQGLASMAQAAQSGNLESANNSAQQAAQALANARSDLANQKAFNQTLSQLQNSRQSLSSAGQPAQQAQGQQGQGQGQGQGGQTAGGGGGTNANSLPPS
ncbi:MAG: hypothetical protein IH586_00135, partial [Anaerolineaceae bacterium]|nr:hypothetical protein [Anaerolineaceae bacterium]